MESHAPHQSPSPGISVGVCHVQTADDRFGDGGQRAVRNRERAAFGLPTSDLSTPFLWPGVESETEETARSSIYSRVPSMQAHRNNLTTLSQVHNLYFVAYQGRIFAYRPRSVPGQNIPGDPDLQLNPKPSKLARSIGGHIDSRRPHLINHIVVGFLGQDEIVIACYDDGDVVAYYVKDIADRISSKLDKSTPTWQPTSAKPRPLLHDNVGSSAWGLAVHAKSRLIAVSSNHREVTIFALAIVKNKAAKDPNKEACNAAESHFEIGLRVRQRARNWRIIVAIGPGAENLPNIAFMDDTKGEADKICAIDIAGVVWMAAIWESGKKAIRMPGYRSLPSEEFRQDYSRGWGIVALPNSSFLKVHTVEEMLGMEPRGPEVSPPTRECPQPMVNVHRQLQAVPDNPCPPWDYTRTNQHTPNINGPLVPDHVVNLWEQLDVDDDDDEDDDESVDEPEPFVGQFVQFEGQNDDMEDEDQGDEEDDDVYGVPIDEDDLYDEGEEDDGAVVEDEEEGEEGDEEDEEDEGEEGESGEENDGEEDGEGAEEEEDESEEEEGAPMPGPNNGASNGPSGASGENEGQAQHIGGQVLFQVAPGPSPVPMGLFQQVPGPSPVQAGPFQQVPGPTPIPLGLFQQPPGPTLVQVGPFQQVPGPVPVPAGPFQQVTGPAPVPAGPFQQPPGPLNPTTGGLGTNAQLMAWNNATNPFVQAFTAIPKGQQKPAIYLRWRHASPLASAESWVRQDMYFRPHNGESGFVPQRHGEMVRFLKTPRWPTLQPDDISQLGTQATQRYHILRTYEKDLELRCLGAEEEKAKKEIGVLCSDAVKFKGFMHPTLRHYFHGTGRLSMVLHVPELLLVVVGSPTGRVILLTPTRLVSRVQHEEGAWAFGFRVERILPKESDETQHRRQMRPLHGLAMAPLQRGEHPSEVGRLRSPALPIRYRLMLHYRNHDILTYEVEREGQSGKLCVF